MKKLLAVLMSLPMAAVAAIDVDPSDTSVTPGVWCGNFPAAKAYAVDNGIPLVLVWGSESCDHCAELSEALSTSSAISWAKAQSAVFCFVEGTASPNQDAKAFAKTAGGTSSTTLTSYPFVCFYTTGIAVSFTGRSGTMYSTTGSTLLAQFQNSYAAYEEALSQLASFCAFPFGDTDNDRLEVVVGETQYIDVPVVRTNDTDAAASCTVTFDYDGSSSSTNISWTAGDTMTFARFELPEAFTTSSEITVTLGDGSASELASRTVHPIAEAENSAKNPYWLGERDADSLAWGEWTMDLDIVTNKVAAWNAANPSKPSYALALIEGSCWCPDCIMAERNIFDNAEFKSWAASSRIVFGVVDIPNNPQAAEAYPSLLRYETNKTSDKFVTLRGTTDADETLRYQSGAGYLSRHSIDYEDAQAVSERNKALMGNDTLSGGWNRPERSNKNRTGVPIFVLLREDGSIAARWNRFSDVGPSAFYPGYLRRFEEMLAMVGEADEESDDDKSSTTRTVSLADSLSGNVSTVDQADVYEIDVAENMHVTYEISGSDAELTASIVNTNGTAIASASGMASEGFSVSARLGTRKCFLKIAPKTIADGSFFGYTNDASTVCAYSVAASGEASGGVIGFSEASTYVTEGTTNQLAVGVTRSDGSAGAASVKVLMTSSTAGARASLEEQTLSWSDGESGEKFAYLTLVDDSEPQETAAIVLGLSGLSADSSNAALADDAVSFTVTLLDDDVYGILLNRNVSYSESVAIVGWQDGDSVSIRKSSGSLPAGLSLSCTTGVVTLAGFPRRAGTYSATYVVQTYRDGAVVATQAITYTFTVRDFSFSDVVPSLASTRTYRSLPVIGSDNRVRGMLNITVPCTGRLSARYWSCDGTVSYSASGWSSYDSATETLTAVLSPSSSTASQMTVALDATGGLAEFEDPSDGADVMVDFSAGVWGASNPALAYAGQYTVQMPQTNMADTAESPRLTGSAYMAMRMVTESAVTNGVMLFAGLLPNGRAFSGTATLSESGGGSALMAFYCRRGDSTAPYVFSGQLAIAANAASSDLWSVFASATPCWESSEAYDHSSDFEVYGGYYDADSVQSRFDSDFSGIESSFGLISDSASLVSSRYGAGDATDDVALLMAEGCPSIDPDDVNAQSASLRFSAWTGVVSGEMYVPFEGGGRIAVTYRGVALPGWQGCSTCADGFVERPWAVGSFSFSDRDSSGAFRNGAGVELGKMW